jgi:hypothetical protein
MMTASEGLPFLVNNQVAGYVHDGIWELPVEQLINRTGTASAAKEPPVGMSLDIHGLEPTEVLGEVTMHISVAGVTRDVRVPLAVFVAVALLVMWGPQYLEVPDNWPEPDTDPQSDGPSPDYPPEWDDPDWGAPPEGDEDY